MRRVIFIFCCLRTRSVGGVCQIFSSLFFPPVQQTTSGIDWPPCEVFFFFRVGWQPINALNVRNKQQHSRLNRESERVGSVLLVSFCGYDISTYCYVQCFSNISFRAVCMPGRLATNFQFMSFDHAFFSDPYMKRGELWYPLPPPDTASFFL